MKKDMSLKKRMENKRLLIWKMAIASALSWEVAKLLGSNHPYLAPISVILCLQTTVNKSIRFSYHRMVGTVIGIVVVVLATPYFRVNGWTLGVLILIGSFIAKWLKRDETAIHQVALTVLLVFVMEHNSGDYPIDRFRDTLIGALIAVILHMLLQPPNYIKEAEKNLQHLTTLVNNMFIRISIWVQTGLKQEEGNYLHAEANQLLQELHLTQDLIKDASDSLKYNFFAKKAELQACQQGIWYLTQGYTYLSAIIDTLTEWSSIGTFTTLQQSIWAEQINKLAPLFSSIRNPAEKVPSGEFVSVSLPDELEKQRFHVSLYDETIGLIKKLNEFPRIRL